MFRLHYALSFVDVIGHVAEKDVVKDTEKNGKWCKVLDITLEDLEWVIPFVLTIVGSTSELIVRRNIYFNLTTYMFFLLLSLIADALHTVERICWNNANISRRTWLIRSRHYCFLTLQAEEIFWFNFLPIPLLPYMLIFFSTMCALTLRSECIVGAMRVSNSFYGKKMFLNADLPEVAAYKTKYG